MAVSQSNKLNDDDDDGDSMKFMNIAHITKKEITRNHGVENVGSRDSMPPDIGFGRVLEKSLSLGGATVFGH